MPNIYIWINHEKNRYYTIKIVKESFSHITLKYNWGGFNSNRGGKKNTFIKTEEEVQCFINQMMKRRKSRGYELITA